MVRNSNLISVFISGPTDCNHSFCLCDTDGDNAINIDELMSDNCKEIQVATYGQSLDNFQGQYAFTLYDQNNDGKIDTEEAAIFINFITGLF